MKIIKFSALWCPSCLIMNSRINKISNTYKIPIIEYDYDIDEEMINKYKVGTILPELILLNEKDEELIRIIGEKSEKKLMNAIEGVLNENT